TWTLATESGGAGGAGGAGGPVGAGRALPRSILRGGVGDFRAVPPTALYSAALGAPGLATAETQLECIGSAVPTPAWTQYAQNPLSIPSQCVDTATAVTISPRPNATVFDPGYIAPRAWRASLGLQQQLAGTYTLTVDASYARGVHQYGFRDLNLVATPRFTLPDEAGRPVYVPADSIVSATGALNSALDVTALGRLTSGVPFTPLVGSDINGDGARNDRAFVFDPATASDSSVAAAMRVLLATAPSGVRDCLGRRLGHVAGRNSCTGPWQPAL